MGCTRRDFMKRVAGYGLVALGLPSMGCISRDMRLEARDLSNGLIVDGPGEYVTPSGAGRDPDLLGRISPNSEIPIYFDLPPGKYEVEISTEWGPVAAVYEDVIKHPVTEDPERIYHRVRVERASKSTAWEEKPRVDVVSRKIETNTGACSERKIVVYHEEYTGSDGEKHYSTLTAPECERAMISYTLGNFDRQETLVYGGEPFSVIISPEINNSPGIEAKRTYFGRVRVTVKKVE